MKSQTYFHWFMLLNTFFSILQLQAADNSKMTNAVSIFQQPTNLSLFQNNRSTSCNIQLALTILHLTQIPTTLKELDESVTRAQTQADIDQLDDITDAYNFLKTELQKQQSSSLTIPLTTQPNSLPEEIDMIELTIQEALRSFNLTKLPQNEDDLQQTIKKALNSISDSNESAAEKQALKRITENDARIVRSAIQERAATTSHTTLP